MKIFFEDEGLSLSLLVVLGETYDRVADVGECFATAGRIVEGDLASAYREWRGTADRIAVIGADCLERGHLVSAREAFFRAASYYRVAGAFKEFDTDDPEFMDTWQKSVETFRSAAQLSESPSIEPVEIPYEGTTLPGYFYRAGSAREPRRTLVAFGGLHSTAEGLLPPAIAATTRGWNALVFDGPGQGRPIREQGLAFRPDWEHVVQPVLDFARSLPEVDGDRIALSGGSLGGYLVVRASAFVDVAATVVHGGVWSLAEGVPDMVPADLLQILDDDPDRFERGMTAVLDAAPMLRGTFALGRQKFGVSSIRGLIKTLKLYTVEGVVDRLTAPTLVLDGEAERAFPGHSKRVFDALTCPKQFICFTVEEGGEEHCQVGAAGLLHQRVFDWLEDLPVFATATPHLSAVKAVG